MSRVRLAVVSLLTSVPLLLGLPAAAHAASHDPVLRRTAPGQRLAAAIALRASDFPGWTRTSNSGSGGNFDCPRVSIDESHHIVNGERERWFQHAGAGEFAYAGGTALVYKDAWMATETFRQAHNPALAICLREMLNKQQEKDFTIRVASSGFVPVPSYAARTADLRLKVTLTGKGAQPLSFPMYADMLILQQRRTLSFAFYMSAFLPRPDEVDRIGRLLSKRVRRQ